jgi:hypothetical protein
MVSSGFLAPLDMTITTRHAGVKETIEYTVSCIRSSVCIVKQKLEQALVV